MQRRQLEIQERELALRERSQESHDFSQFRDGQCVNQERCDQAALMLGMCPCGKPMDHTKFCYE